MKKQPESKSSLDGRSKQPRSRLREMSAKGVIDSANSVVSKAANILEEEIAAGIIAAKELEKKFINVEKERNKEPDHLMSRFRTDVHEVIDMLMDVVSVASSQLESISKKVVDISAASETNNATTAEHVPIIRNREQALPGEESTLTMELHNGHKENTMEVSLQESDLIGPGGKRILARNIKMKPKSLKLKPGEKKELKIAVSIPKSTPAGSYSGLLVDKSISNLRAMVSLEVSG